MTKYFPLTAAIVLGIVNDFRISLKLIALLFLLMGPLSTAELSTSQWCCKRFL